VVVLNDLLKPIDFGFKRSRVRGTGPIACIFLDLLNPHVLELLKLLIFIHADDVVWRQLCLSSGHGFASPESARSSYLYSVVGYLGMLIVQVSRTFSALTLLVGQQEEKYYISWTCSPKLSCGSSIIVLITRGS